MGSVPQLYCGDVNSIYKINNRLCPNRLVFSSEIKAEIFVNIFENQLTLNFGTNLPEATNAVNTIRKTPTSKILLNTSGTT